jgi:hypothetical protein
MLPRANRFTINVRSSGQHCLEEGSARSAPSRGEWLREGCRNLFEQTIRGFHTLFVHLLNISESEGKRLPPNRTIFRLPEDLSSQSNCICAFAERFHIFVFSWRLTLLRRQSRLTMRNNWIAIHPTSRASTFQRPPKDNRLRHNRRTYLRKCFVARFPEEEAKHAL